MNFLKKIFIIFMMTVFMPLILSAQAPKSFSDNPMEWFKQIKDFLYETNKDQTKELMGKFDLVWNQGKISPGQQTIVMEMSNSMLRKRLKAYPEFSNYINAIIGFNASAQSNEAFVKWNQSLDKMLTGSTKRVSEYINICAGIFTNQTLYESASTKWTASSSNYIFEYDSMPRISFPVTDIACYAKGDSSVIYNVKGVYYPFLRKFIATGGKFYWTRAGLEPAETFADLKTTIIDLTGSDFISDSITFHHKKYFKTPLVGRLTDKILANVTVENASYPRFDSYNLDLTIKELIKDADYRGGFSMHGKKMIGSGSKDQKATLTFKRKDKPFLVASSRNFTVTDDRILSDNASFAIYFDKDSISHPGLRLKYINKDRQLSLVRNTESGLQMPFYDSYHQMDIMVDGIYWKIDDPLMEFKMLSGAGENKMVLESSKYYSDLRFEKIQGMSEQNPLFMLKQYAERTGRLIFVPDFAKSLKTSETTARSLIFYLAERGYVSYDRELDEATLSDKLYYYLSARSNKTDYDKLEISSLIDAKANAKLNLLNFELDMQGVARINLSDSQNVFIVPTDQQLLLKKNRDIGFSGRVHAGRTDFFGKNFAFNYDKFLFDLGQIDSLRLKIESGELDEYGKPKLVPLRGMLQNLSGTLYIDSLNNKSGRKNFPAYPYFVSTKESYIYYDDRQVYNGVYKRDNFYFKIDPFTIDSLDNYVAGALAFDGEFNSAGIFPSFREKAVIRPDLSFGFERETPAEGYQAYGGKGKFFDHLDLSYNGLKGHGRVEYLSSVTVSDKFIFFPDSTVASPGHFELRNEVVEGTAFPQATGKDINISWLPYKDMMHVYKTNTDLSLYNNTVDLDGNLLLAKKGLGGDGKALYNGSELLSRNFYFETSAYGADTSDFNLKSADKDVMAIATKNVRSKIDFTKRMGVFSSNGKGSFVSFPLNQYICFISEFKWFMDNKEVEFASNENTKVNILGSDFVSVNPLQDSLRWNAGLARYSIVDYLIKAKKVKEILVADASIQPDDTSTIIIEKNAVMLPLENATIVANTVTKYHRMIECTINILGRKSYYGNGKYAYKDQAGVNHLITLDRISVDTTLQTYANGVIPEALNFQLNTNIQYKGKVKIAAGNPLLNFDGFARVNHSCIDQLKVDWFSFNGDIDPKGVNIPVKEPRNETLQKLAVAISAANDSSGFYSSFLSPKKNGGDPDIISADGFLAYDSKNNRYKVATIDKINNEDLPGNIISLDNNKCLVKGEGKIDLGINFGQFKTTANGTVVNNLNTDSTEFDLLLGLNFMFNDDAMKSIVEMIGNYPTLQPTNDGRQLWIRGMKTILGNDAADKLTSEFNLYGAPKKVPQPLQQTIFLTDLKLYWDRMSQGFRNRGKIGVGFIGKNTVSRMLTGYMEILRRRSGDLFSFYLEVDKNNWWFFTYSRGIMQSISSDEKFNEAIRNMKADKRIADTKDNKPPYEFMLSTDRRKAEFTRRMKGE